MRKAMEKTMPVKAIMPEAMADNTLVATTGVYSDEGTARSTSTLGIKIAQQPGGNDIQRGDEPQALGGAGADVKPG